MKRAFFITNRIIEYLLIIIFALLVLDVLWQVIARHLVGSSSSFTEEFARFAFIWLAILGAAYLNGQRGHLAIDFWLNKLDAEKRKQRQVIIEILMLIFAIIVMVIGGGNLVYITLSLGQKSSVLGIPLGVVYAIVPFSGLLIVFYSLFHISQPEALETKEKSS